jgi:hypothetical protein
MATKKTASKRPENRPPRPAGASSSRTRASASSEDAEKKPAAPRASSATGKKTSGATVASNAARQLLELTGRQAEGVTGLKKTDDGWQVQVEVVEVRRIPDTTDVLALYEIDVDSDGDLLGYRRLRRYARGVPGEG